MPNSHLLFASTYYTNIYAGQQPISLQIHAKHEEFRRLDVN